MDSSTDPPPQAKNDIPSHTSSSQHASTTLPPISHFSSPPSYAQSTWRPDSKQALLSSSDRSGHDRLHHHLPPLTSLTDSHSLAPPLSRDSQGREAMLTQQSPNLPLWPGNIQSPQPAHQPARRYPSDSPNIMDLDQRSAGSPHASITGIASPGAASSLTLDDPDVRLAAEALGDLRADFMSSPPTSSTPQPFSPPAPTLQAVVSRDVVGPNDEPLLSLLTTAHPLFRSTIGGATSAYGGAKNYSPRFKSGAEYVEGYLGPIANTVGSVSRVTGVEGGVRWFLGANRRANSNSDLENAGTSKKRRKVDNGEESIAVYRADSRDVSGHATPSTSDSYPPTPKGDRRLSMASTVDTLPAYDDARSPAYTELMETQKHGTQPAPAIPKAWQHRLIMSTSGLSVAMSEESLRSLKYCLRWLKWANEHMARAMTALKTTLEEYDKAPSAETEALQTQMELQQEEGAATDGGAAAAAALVPYDEATASSARSKTILAARINSLRGDVLKTLQDVVNTVSKYAGGALPENAKVLVRRHLTSLPQRFRVATMEEGEEEGQSSSGEGSEKDSESAMREGAQKMLVLAKEGLDMVSQISGVLDGTIHSAEEWCDRMGKRRRREESIEAGPVLPQNVGDVAMGGAAQ